MLHFPDQAKSSVVASTLRDNYIQKADSLPTGTYATPAIADPFEVLFNHFFNQYLTSYLLEGRQNNTLKANPKVEVVSEPNIDITTKVTPISEVPTEEVTTSAPKQAHDKCKYYCMKHGGCSVRILPKSGFLPGKVMGYVSSRSFMYNCA